MDKPGLLDWVIAPLTWLERAKGWKRAVLVLLYAMILLVVAVLGWLEYSLWGLPDIGEPFERARYETVDVPDSTNAMVLYREAAEKLGHASQSRYPLPSAKAWNDLDWSTTDPGVRQWVVDNRPALAIWRAGTERPESVFIQPREMGHQQSSEPLIALQSFAKMARLEASRLEADGNLEGAWDLHRAILRASRHVGMHGPTLQRFIGQEILVKHGPDLLRWVEDPRVTANLLRRAIADIEACKAMTSPNSEMFRANYFAMSSLIEQGGGQSGQPIGLGLENPDGSWYEHLTIVPMARRFLRREPERSRRVLRLITAGILAQCDRPRTSRPRLVPSRTMIYDVDDHTPANVAAVPPEELAKWFEGSGCANISAELSFIFPRIDVESNAFDGTLIRMAARAFEIEHGRPPKTYGDLVGPYLKALPEGTEAAEPVGAP